MMTRYLSLSLAFVVLLSVVGCGEKVQKADDASRNKVFLSASADIKGQWEKAMAAVAAKNYYEATMVITSMRQGGKLTPEQSKAVDEALVAISDEMYTAASKGDPKAQESLDQLKKMQQR